MDLETHKDNSIEVEVGLDNSKEIRKMSKTYTGNLKNTYNTNLDVRHEVMNQAIDSSKKLINTQEALALNKSPPFKNQSRNYLQGRLLVDNEFSRSLRKHLNVVSSSNASKTQFIKEKGV